MKAVNRIREMGAVDLIVGRCFCRDVTFHPFGKQCRLCAFYANRDLKYVSKEEYDEIVAKAALIEQEYLEAVRQANKS